MFEKILETSKYIKVKVSNKMSFKKTIGICSASNFLGQIVGSSSDPRSMHFYTCCIFYTYRVTHKEWDFRDYIYLTHKIQSINMADKKIKYVF